MPRGPGRARTRGAHLRELREAAQCSLRELGDTAGVGPDVISKAERGVQNLSLAGTILVAAALTKLLNRHITVEELTVVADDHRPAGAA